MEGLQIDENGDISCQQGTWSRENDGKPNEPLKFYIHHADFIPDDPFCSIPDGPLFRSTTLFDLLDGSFLRPNPSAHTLMISSKERSVDYYGNFYDDDMHIHGKGFFDAQYGKNTIFLYEKNDLSEDSRKIVLQKSTPTHTASNEINFSNIKDVHSKEDLTFTFKEDMGAFVIAKKMSGEIITTVQVQQYDLDTQVIRVSIFKNMDDLMSACTMTFNPREEETSSKVEATLETLSEVVWPLRSLPDYSTFHLKDNEEDIIIIQSQENDPDVEIIFLDPITNNDTFTTDCYTYWTLEATLEPLSEVIWPLKALPDYPTFHLKDNEEDRTIIQAAHPNGNEVSTTILQSQKNDPDVEIIFLDPITHSDPSMTDFYI